MKKEITIESINHHSRRKLVASIDLDEKGNPMPSMTDQDQNLDTDINVIVARYRKTGVLPEIKTSTALQYFDTTQVPSFQDAQNRLANAKTMFEQLPAQLRFYMDNDFLLMAIFFILHLFFLIQYAILYLLHALYVYIELLKQAFLHHE